MIETGASMHFIGIGGIGMSGLAQMAKSLGMRVSGSDRGYGKSENKIIFDALEQQGIRIYPQDGSFVKQERTSAIVYSSAIEEDNPDFAAGKDIPMMHRSVALAEIMKSHPAKCTIAVTGSCGKTSVTAYMAETMLNMGVDVSCLDGGLVNRFRDGHMAGNYRHGAGDYLVFEADESDKSLVNYNPDYAVILNLGTDHYSKEELVKVFGEFLRKVKTGAVLERQVYDLLKKEIPEHLNVKVFSAGETDDPTTIALSQYGKISRAELIYYGPRRSEVAAERDCAREELIGSNNFMDIIGMKRESFRIEGEYFSARFSDGASLVLPQHGKHTALNALAIYATLGMTGFEGDSILRGLETFGGVWRRGDFAGIMENGMAVYDDYSHNPEKIASCINGMREIAGGRIFAIFQPHGYGPLGFMREELFNVLEQSLAKGDVFIFLPPYYAGGTSSFKPTSEEVAAEYQSESRTKSRYFCFSGREELAEYLKRNGGPGDLALIMGARDNSLSDFAGSLASR